MVPSAQTKVTMTAVMYHVWTPHPSPGTHWHWPCSGDIGGYLGKWIQLRPAPGPGVNSHSPTSTPPASGSSKLGISGRGFSQRGLPPEPRAPRSTLAPPRFPQGAGAGAEQTPGAQAAGSAGRPPPEDGDETNPHQPAPAAPRSPHGGGQQPLCHAHAGEGDSP